MKTDALYDPTLTLIYLPHLDYGLQKFGHDFDKIGKDLQELDALLKQLVTYYESKAAEVIILSEYGIVPVQRPVHLNRVLREHGLLQIRVERGLELLDAGASKAFAVADHQLAHIYLNDPAVLAQVKAVLTTLPGVAQVLDEAGKKLHGIDHERAGDLVLIAEPDSWFTYYFWLDDAVAPDYARCVDIHKKPGYDPVEMFMRSKGRAAYKLLRKKAGFRYVMDVVPLDATLIKGSHGSINVPEAFYPVIISGQVPSGSLMEATAVHDVIWNTLMQDEL